MLMAEEEHFERWEAADDALRERVYADFRAFSEAVRSRGSIVAGDALDRPGTARSVRPGADRVVTEGPYAETVEQLGGFYLIESDDLEDLLDTCGILAGVESSI